MLSDAAQDVLGASDGTWHRRAACRDRSPALFDGATREDCRIALTICLHCPVRVQCGREAEELGVTYGIRGGRVLHKVGG